MSDDYAFPEPFGPFHERPANPPCPDCDCCTAVLCEQGRSNVSGCLLAGDPDPGMRERLAKCPCTTGPDSFNGEWRLLVDACNRGEIAEDVYREPRIPKRIQRKRESGWRRGDSVIVDRTSKWGNPFKVGKQIRRDSPLWPYIAATVPGGAGDLVALIPLTDEQATDLYASWIIEQPHLMLPLDELAGKDLACPCKLPKPGEPDHCHAAFLIELVQEVCRA